MAFPFELNSEIIITYPLSYVNRAIIHARAASFTQTQQTSEILVIKGGKSLFARDRGLDR